VCLNVAGAARSFSDVCAAMDYLGAKTEAVVVAVGLGDCKELYGSCLYTEWFDLDEPCKKGEVESVYVSNVYAMSLGKYVRAHAFWST